MKKTLAVLALFVTFAISAPTAEACSVMEGWPPSASVNLKEKDGAFVGTVKSVYQDKSANADYRITFEVDETYKGSFDDTVTVRARYSSAACGYDDGYETFEKGTVWMIYVYGNESEGYHTDSISLNTKYKSVAEANKAAEKLGLLPVDEDRPTVCPMNYAPVCGKAKDGTTKTYGNTCMLNAEKAELLYQGECATDAVAPTRDLWKGARGVDVTWLQEFLIGKLTGAAARALQAVGATGYFGTLTTQALAEYQSAHSIAPAYGYFGAKTRAAITRATPAMTATFEGKISAVNTGCFADGMCSVTVDGKEVVLLTGMRIGAMPAVGSLKGVDSIGDLEDEIGSTAKVYAAKNPTESPSYSLYGSTAYYVEVLK